MAVVSLSVPFLLDAGVIIHGASHYVDYGEIWGSVNHIIEKKMLVAARGLFDVGRYEGKSALTLAFDVNRERTSD